MKSKKEGAGIALFLLFIAAVAMGSLIVPALRGMDSPGGAAPGLQILVGVLVVLLFGLFAWAMLGPDTGHPRWSRAVDMMDRVDRYVDRQKYR